MYYLTANTMTGRRYTLAYLDKPTLKEHHREFINNLNLPQDYSYNTFQIPKASGGYRTITAPNPSLKEIQRTLTATLKHNYHILEGPWAYAFTEGRSTVDALKQHTNNESKWFLKLDIKDFFPSCTKNTVRTQLTKLFPICSWSEGSQNNFLNYLDRVIYHNDSLPQGAPSSPYISNLVMIPYDYQIKELLKNADNFRKQKYVYTRYADDIIISARKPFDYHKILEAISNVLGQHFQINTDKTRYGSSSGRNWNLGCMVNKENNITIGYKQKQDWKRKMMQIIIQHSTNPNALTNAEKGHLQGKLAYYKMIEPGYFEYLNRHYHEKYNVNFEQIIKPNQV